jgi:hypothetical protein
MLLTTPNVMGISLPILVIALMGTYPGKDEILMMKNEKTGT